MIKEAVEDYKRHRQDVEVNNRKVQVCPMAVVPWQCRFLCASSGTACVCCCCRGQGGYGIVIRFMHLCHYDDARQPLPACAMLRPEQRPRVCVQLLTLHVSGLQQQQQQV